MVRQWDHLSVPKAKFGGQSPEAGKLIVMFFFREQDLI